MGHTRTTSRSPAAAPARVAPAPSVRRTLLETCRMLVKDIAGTYHPERHYMRGPGPKWHAKHAGA